MRIMPSELSAQCIYTAWVVIYACYPFCHLILSIDSMGGQQRTSKCPEPDYPKPIVEIQSNLQLLRFCQNAPFHILAYNLFTVREQQGTPPAPSPPWPEPGAYLGIPTTLLVVC